MPNSISKIWKLEDVRQLLSNISANLPNVGAIKYSTANGLIDWDAIKFKSYEREDCQSKWLEILESVRDFRTLPEVVNDAVNVFNQSTPRPSTEQLSDIPSKKAKIPEPIRRSKRNLNKKSNKTIINTGKKIIAVENLAECSKWQPVIYLGKKVDSAALVESYKKKQKEKKKPQRAYHRFFAEEYKRLKSKYPLMSYHQMASLCGKNFRSLSTEERNAYYEAYNNDMRVYNERNKVLSLGDVRDDVEPELEGFEETIVNEEGSRVSDRRLLIGNSLKQQRFGFYCYIDENYCKLENTNKEDKLIVLENLWASLDDDDREVYIEKYFNFANEERVKLSARVTQQIG